MPAKHNFVIAFMLASVLAHAEDDELIGPRREAAVHASKYPFALDSTFEERVKASPRNQLMSGDVLVFPQNTVAFPEPFVRHAGERVLDAAMPETDFDPSVWLVVPKVPAMDEYLQKRAETPAPKGTELADWCAKHALPQCEAFELKRLLAQFKSFNDPGYAPLNTRWLKFADTRQSDVVFPLPFSGEWTVNPDPTRHHRLKAGAAYAFDMTVVNGGATFKTNPSKLENYYAWGQPIRAQADGVVTQVMNDQPDAPAGQSGGFDNANYVMVYYGGGISGFYCHCQHGSAKVKVGDRVKAGDPLALVGNSGAAGFPHLHFTMLDSACLSMRGRYRFQVQRNGQWVNVDGEDLAPGTLVRNVEAKKD